VISDAPPPEVDLREARSIAVAAAAHWGLELGEPFQFSNASYVAPSGSLVLKVPWGGDDESMHEGEALRAWDGRGAIRLRDQCGAALLEDRAVPGTDLAQVPEREATALAVHVAQLLWLPGRSPFRPVLPAVCGWLERAALARRPNVTLALSLLPEVEADAQWLVHGDLHHHNILLDGARFVAIDPKPYLCQREYDVAPFLWNPRNNPFDDRSLIERRIAAFTACGLDDRLIRVWAVIRGAYLRPQLASQLAALLEA
jgi:streptomycin 6-kinase